MKTVLIYVALVALFFMPVDVPYKMVFPLALLSVVAWWDRPILVATALTFSCIGDLMGVLHLFPAQLSAFAVCHVLLTAHFFRRMPAGEWLSHLGVLVASAILLVCIAFTLLPSVPGWGLRGAVLFYAVVIIAMAFSASCLHDNLLTIGALFFLLSDTILGYNRFVEHIPNATLLIMFPYYTAQLLIFQRTGRQARPAA